MVKVSMKHRTLHWILPSLIALVALVCPWTSLQAAELSKGVTAYTFEEELETRTVQSYLLSDGRGEDHGFSVSFDSEGNVVSTSGGGSEEVLLGTEKGTQAALAALAALHDQGIDKLVINAEAPDSTSAEGWLVVNQTASPTDPDLPASSSYDAVLSAPADGGRTLLFFSEGELVEARTYAAGASGMLQVKVTIEIDCEITWDSENGFRIHCTIRVKVGPFTIIDEEIVWPSS